MAREEYALSARTTSGRVRGRPRGRGTRRRAITSGNAGASPACPAVRTKTRGLHRSSDARWTLVVSPPRDRPMAWSCGSPAGALFTGPGRVLMRANDGGVDRDRPVQVLGGISLGQQRGEDPLPRAIHGPHPQPVVDPAPVAVFLRQVHPLRSGLELPRDRVDHLTVIPPPPTTPGRPVRQQRLDQRPLRVGQRHTRTNDQMIRMKRVKRMPLSRARSTSFSAPPRMKPASRFSRLNSSAEFTRPFTKIGGLVGKRSAP